MPENKQHILIVEDEPVSREMLADFLSGEGYQVSTAGDGEEMKDVLLSGSRKVDLILLDNMQPAQVRLIVRRFSNCGIPLEVSGGVNAKNIASYARTGVERISIGALTHSPASLDLSCQLYPET